jgi:oligopeptide/dipeptide ABC transporter ATP-binding protein
VLLDVRDLCVDLVGLPGTATAVGGVSFTLDAGQALAVIGESGSGKTLTALALVQLLPRAARLVSGEILLDGVDLTKLRGAEMRAVRGRRIGMVFQNPAAALNPVLRVGGQMIEALRAHERLSSAVATARTVDLLAQVGVPAPADRMKAFPHELSGGLQQRVLLAMAIGSRPALLVADEPTTALDAILQAEILALLRHLRSQMGMALLLITHDLGVAAQACEEIVVMYAGRVVERAPTATLLHAPAHPYSAGLLRSIPGGAAGRRLAEIPGRAPTPFEAAPGCRFASRCTRAVDRCIAEEPPLVALAGTQSHQVRCFFPEGSA